jgi:hypothetical protein
MTMPDPIEPEQAMREFKNYSGNFLNIPPYSSDLGPSDFHLFGPLKKGLDGRPDVSLMAKWLRQQSKYFNAAVGFDALHKRSDTCIIIGEGYV